MSNVELRMMKEEVGIRVQTQMVVLRVLCTWYMVLSTLYNVVLHFFVFF